MAAGPPGVGTQALCVGLLVARVENCRPGSPPIGCNCHRRPGPATAGGAAFEPHGRLRMESAPDHRGDGQVIRSLLAISVAASLAAQTPNLLEQADEAFRQRDFARAGALAQRVVDSDPAAIHGHMILGVIAAQENQWEVSNRRFQTVIGLDPSNPYGYL